MAKYFSPEIETASRDYLHAIQSARLIKTVKRCYENIPSYKAKFDEIGPVSYTHLLQQLHDRSRFVDRSAQRDCGADERER